MLVQIAVEAQTKRKFVAITFDDLPAVAGSGEIEPRREVTRKIVKQLTDAKISVTAFVNEIQLYDYQDKRDESEVDLLRQWLDAGFELGNHTFSHRSLHNLTLAEYTADITRGEPITRELLQAKGLKLRYFRHPFLETGFDNAQKSGLEQFLRENNYTVAPVTIEFADWLFSDAYNKAAKKPNAKELREQIGKLYVEFFDKKIVYWEHQTRQLFNRDIKQILLVHANSINADYFDQILQVLKKRNYRVITLDAALRDKAYQSKDTYIGEGVSWLHRWAISRGGEKLVLDGEPEPPKLVKDISGEDDK